MKNKNKIDIIIFSGQSNMQGQAESLSECEVVTGAYEYRFLTDEIKPLSNPVGETVCFDRSAGEDLSPDVPLREVLKDWLAAHVVGASAYGYTNLVPEFCRAYIKETNREVLAVHAAKGSTEIEYWRPEGDAYAFLVDKIRAAIQKAKECYDIGNVYFVWLQGESDAIASRSKEYYKEKLLQLGAALKQELGIAKFGVIRVGRFTGDARDDEIIAAQVEVCRESSDFLMLTEICEDLPSMEGYMNPTVPGHYSAKGYEAIGHAAGNALGDYCTCEGKKQKKDMRRTFSIAGWAVLAATAATYLFSFLLGIILGLALGEGAQRIINEYLLVFNQVIVVLSMLTGGLVLVLLPKNEPVRSKLSPKKFFAFLCVCFAIGWVGNIVGNVWISVWNALTGNAVTNPLNDLLMSISPWQMILCTGIAAPLIEEFIFRKLIIDRTIKCGQMAAIVMSAAFFGIFHMNFSQFFYAFGVGLVLGYVYCKTGRYRTVVLLHMAFNFIMGVLPALLAPDVIKFSLEFTELTVTEADPEAILALLATFAIPLACYCIYAFVQGALNITGIVLFCLNVKKVDVKKSPLIIDAKTQRRAAVLNFGVVAALAVLVILTVSTLFTA